ncbi:MAG: hypothetical protein JWL81_1140 [Verrucomicrobiales bacterium]|nr:hypothetical protein [Verrucomicrobiales bacterium]
MRDPLEIPSAFDHGKAEKFTTKGGSRNGKASYLGALRNKVIHKNGVGGKFVGGWTGGFVGEGAAAGRLWGLRLGGGCGGGKGDLSGDTRAGRPGLLSLLLFG